MVTGYGNSSKLRQSTRIKAIVHTATTIPQQPVIVGGFQRTLGVSSAGDCERQGCGCVLFHPFCDYWRGRWSLASVWSRSRSWSLEYVVSAIDGALSLLACLALAFFTAMVRLPTYCAPLGVFLTCYFSQYV